MSACRSLAGALAALAVAAPVADAGGWTRHASLDRAEVGVVVFDGAGHGRLWATTSFGGGLYVRDASRSFVRVRRSIGTVQDLATPSDGDRGVVVAATTGVWRVVDARHATRLHAGVARSVAAAGAVIVAVLDSGDVVSADGGRTWRGVQVPDDAFDAELSHVATVGGGAVAITVEGESSDLGRELTQVFTSADHGVTWAVAPAEGVAGGARDRLVLASDDGLRETRDGGRTWSAPRGGGACVADVVAVAGGRVWERTCRGRIRISDDGGATWSQRPALGRGSAVAADPSAPAGVAVGAVGVRLSDDGGRTARTLNRGLGGRVGAVVADPAVPGLLFATPGSGAIQRSADGGRSWRGRSIAADRLVLASRSSSSVLYAFGRDDYRSLDEGTSWGRACSCIAFDPADHARAWQVGARRALLHARDGMTFHRSGTVPQNTCGIVATRGAIVARGCNGTFRRSADGGVTWGAILHTPAPAQVPEPLVGSPRARSVLFWLAGDRVWITTDGGRRFRPVRGLPAGVSLEALTADARARGVLYAATSSGLYVSRNGGRSFAPAGITAWAHDVAVTATRVYVATDEGLFSRARS